MWLTTNGILIMIVWVMLVMTMMIMMVFLMSRTIVPVNIMMAKPTLMVIGLVLIENVMMIITEETMIQTIVLSFPIPASKILTDTKKLSKRGIFVMMMMIMTAFPMLWITALIRRECMDIKTICIAARVKLIRSEERR